MSLPRPTQVSAIHTQVERFELTRPYAISFRAMMDHVENVVVRLETADGHVGHGAACPEHFVTGETNEACRAALADDRLEWLLGQDVRTLSRLCRELGERLPAAPAARAALDMALHDLYAQHLDLPLVEVLGRAHTRLPTSITIGIKPLQETLDEAAEYIERGFRILKVKLGESLEQDLERLFKLHERYGDQVSMRVDPNQGYGPADVEAFVAKTETLGLEFLEQPMAADAIEAMRALPEHIRARVAADESLLNERDAINLLRPRARLRHFQHQAHEVRRRAPGVEDRRHRARAGHRTHVGLHGREHHQHQRGVARRPRLTRDPLPGPGRQPRSGPRRRHRRLHPRRRPDAHQRRTGAWCHAAALRYGDRSAPAAHARIVDGTYFVSERPTETLRSHFHAG